MILRTASISDLSLLEYWDEQPHVIESDPDDDWNWEVELKKFPKWREQLVAEVGNEPIGFIQIIDPKEEETHYWGDVEPNLRAIDIWIGEAKNLNKGYGTQMMQLAINRCFKPDKVTSILIDPLSSNKLAHRFYEHMGFQFLREQTFEQSHCYVYQLTRNRWNSFSKINLREAVRSDTDVIRQLFRETILAIGQQDYSSEQLSAWANRLDPKRLQNALEEQYFLIAEMDGSTVGFGSIHNSYLDFLYVHKDHQRKGIADKIYLELERYTRKQNQEKINSDASKTAKPFFQKKGFQVVKENSNTIQGVEIINYRMEKKLE